MRRRCLFVSLSLLILTGIGSAQMLSVTMTPNPAPSMTNITISVFNRSGGPLFTPGGCLVTTIRSGSPTGPIVRAFPCTFLGVAIPACNSGLATRMTTWNQAVSPSGFATPGDYYFEILHSPSQFGPISAEYYCVTISGATPSPALSAVNAPVVGQPFNMAINSPSDPFAFYAVVLSFSTNVGTVVTPTLRMCLDQDALFTLTFPAPPPQAVNFQGGLDSIGQTNSIFRLIPNAPVISCLALHAQAGLLTITGNVVLTNDLPFTIL